MSVEINSLDFLARHVCKTNRKNYCRANNGTVKPKAFKPNSMGKTSVFVVTGLPSSEICSLGNKHVCTKKDVHGFAKIEATHVINENLSIDFDDSPKGHANLINWPDHKDAIQDIAHVLAAESECVLCE